MIRSNANGLVLVLEILRIGSTGRVQPSASILRREAGLLLETLQDCASKEGPSSDSILRREIRNLAVASETRSTQDQQGLN